MPTRITLAALLAVGLLAAGCGGDDDDETTTDTTTAEAGATGASGASGESGQAAGGGLLPDDFATEANTVCEEGNQQLDSEATAFFTEDEPTDAEQEAFVTDIVAPSIQAQIDAIRDLGDPEEGAEELSAFLDDAQSALDQIEDDPLAFVQEAGEEDPFADVERQAVELGLPACAN